ncbi:DNA topoisomerase-1 [Catalinimonas alkaloidigena]|uniref:DNA topoisomerase 1 n=1 Tax=Catalinimonas alkaloidigena TaxID=1075417 RepID=A0A1G8X0L9_9BACT|nr:type I DNA topoisomerase [Catalinimonas alkaloidigena]SDJ84073.1 DNA topoisomerase-1 [Catalinimonas alkaloidigena]
MKLLIVESPNKIKKLKTLLDPSWEVAASVGHIRDLPRKSLGIDPLRGHKMLYEICHDKQKVVAGLRDRVQRVGKENIYLATDPDREGEAIAFHLCAALGLDFRTTPRVAFQELTKAAVTKALAAPRTVDLQLVAAQESRRAIDRLVGYRISPVLWKQLESGLSAGRVQSVALRLVVERERAIGAFTETYQFQVTGTFRTPKGDLLKAKRTQPLATEQDAEAYLNASIAKTFRVVSIETKPLTKNPPPPYATSSLQQDGVRKLKMSAKRVMEVAQKLFEAGHITYMRTDSVNLSEEAIQQATQRIRALYGEEYVEERRFKSKAGAQEAHEAIRPTHWESPAAGSTQDEQDLYDLIYRRALASQMQAARYEQTTVTIHSNVSDDEFISRAKVLLFDGYLKVYQEEADDKDDDENTTIQPVHEGDPLERKLLEARQAYTHPPKRYDQASLVSDLEKKGIGRPSTYASILSTLFYRAYVETKNAPGKSVTAVLLTLKGDTIQRKEKKEKLGAEKNKLHPTDKGQRLVGYMEEHFTQVMDYTFTAKCETLFDQVAEGKRGYKDLVPAFDRRLGIWLEATGERAGLSSPARELGQHEGHPVMIGESTYGPYLRYKDQFYKLTQPPADVTIESAIATIQAQQEERAKSLVAQVGKYYQIRRGPYGLYVTDGKVKASLPRGITAEEAATWKVEQCKQVVQDYKEWKKKQKAKAS